MFNSLLVRRVLRGRKIVVLFGTKYVVPQRIKPVNLDLSIRRS